MTELTKENFDAEVTEAEGVVFVDFWSPKCEECLTLNPEVEVLAERYAGRVKFCKLDAAGNRRLSIAQKVMGLPAFVIYVNGEKVFMLDPGSISIEAAQAKLDELIGSCGSPWD